jgi:hypothetical protein
VATAIQICAVRLPRLPERLERAAQEAGGWRRLVERMLGQQLPTRDWFRARRIKPPYPAKVSFRLPRETVRRLRAVTGTRSLSDAVRLLLLYTFTAEAAASATRPAPHAPSVPPFGASLPVSRPAPPPGPSSPPPGRSPIVAAPHPFHRSPQMGFEHRPVLPAGQHYSCEVRECINWLSDGVVARCSQHEKARSFR